MIQISSILINDEYRILEHIEVCKNMSNHIYIYIPKVNIAFFSDMGNIMDKISAKKLFIF